MAQTNDHLAAIFAQLAALTEILTADKFRVLAFQKASRILGDLTQDVKEIGADMKALTALDGIGKGTAERIIEFLTTNQIKEHVELLAKVPTGLPALLNIPGLGPKTVALLWKEGGITCVADLTLKLQGDDLAKIPGMGAKKLDNLRKNLSFATTAAQRARIGEAMPLALHLVQRLRDIPGVKEAAYAGSLRRGKETIGDVDILVSAEPKHVGPISEAFVKLMPGAEVIARGETKVSVRTTAEQHALQVDLRVVSPDSFGAAYTYFTGSKDHNVKLRQRAIDRGLRLNEYGLLKNEKSIAGKTEEEVYAALDLKWIPPELREDRDEIALAEKNQLPVLLTLPDIHAELHAHTTASDGRWSIRELVQTALDRGFHTIAITDHSKSQPIANGLSAERLEQHIKDVRAIAAEYKKKINVLAGSEVDILAEGDMDYPDSLLRELDIVVASPHNALSQDPAKATKRLLKAINNRYVTILGHPTGRLIGRREGLSPDMDQLIRAAAQRGIAMEINANSWRLDLRDTHARAALAAGVKLAINTDAHSYPDLDQLYYGVLTARRAGATKAHVINCLSREDLANWLKSTRA